MPFCFMGLSLKRKIISLNNINRFVPVMGTQFLFCAVETEILKHCVEELGTPES
jgi:hypothetical protein